MDDPHGSIGDFTKVLTFCVEHFWYVQVLFCDVECQVQVLQWVVLAEFRVVQQIGTVAVDEGAEGKPISPAKQHRIRTLIKILFFLLSVLKIHLIWGSDTHDKLSEM